MVFVSNTGLRAGDLGFKGMDDCGQLLGLSAIWASGLLIALASSSSHLAVG